ncbi:MAG: holA [Bacteroidetes bacterium]|jgi:DNA polymerase-3 subunit delta|nr:holA [Bacteroidota bacterium]
MKEYEEILTDLKRKILKPVYFLCGEEPYFIDKISDYIEHTILDESEREFNQSVLYGREISMAEIIGSAKRFPMMSDYQVVIVKEAQNLKEFSKGGGDDEGDSKAASGKNPFLAYVENPQPSTILVICHKYKSLDKRTALYKTLQKKAVFLDSGKLYDNQVPGWINEYIKEKKYRINPRASQMLADYLGNDLSKISNELDKLFISIPEGSEISAEQIQDNIGISKDFNVFELQDALAKKDVLKSNMIVNYFAANPKDNPMPVLMSNLYNYFNKVLQYHFVADKNKFNVAKELGVNPFFVDGYQRAASNYPSSKLKAIFGFLRECDTKSKGVDNASATDGELMKELVFKILH